ncbi:speckle targeted PIP5K1A-regulated poly(A) polymerase-like isoform X2 [Ischnura elegans]|nr:speckle targeted PIP5K1A-regulated poly(A) polymerase-like isoform X2 [Ischnura elegans]XP_046382623.1 speckle targeted PIP5K1A-regulated poly(A) polymerase-like isoform X2 [Ischnura elegans]XP_046382624.1 speckle targeted PIP5K1A-regulated poly(A) polymerase-like isoform X2 [Ischnura elegans]XP_046382625.1 speckle targeted PIP5K1A-regulated poly(A) polymerase-like isoform X2 [Ischnura elegans]XP_046382626.1 speckle targeted PIP5K1A-regulated poly(A) polymerase-like isoform X2 [Ischnura eleg
MRSLKVTSGKNSASGSKSFLSEVSCTSSVSCHCEKHSVSHKFNTQEGAECMKSKNKSENRSLKDFGMNKELLDSKTKPHLASCGFHNDTNVAADISGGSVDSSSQKKPSKSIVILGIPDKTDRKIVIRQFAKYGLIKSNKFIGAAVHIEYINCQSVEKVLADQAKQKICVDGKEILVQKSGKTAKKAFQIGKIPINAKMLLCSEEMFLERLDGFLVKYQLSSCDIEKQQLVCECILSSLKYFSPRLYPYGSRVTGLASEDSDLDLFIDITKPCHYVNSKYQRTTQELIIHDAAEDIISSGNFRNIVQIPQANVPLLSCVHIHTGLKCDLTFRYPHQVQNTSLIRTFLSIDHRVRPLILLIRHWIKAHRLSGQGKFSSYSISLMCIFYLQQIPNKPVLPSVALLMKFAKDQERVLIENWDCGFSEDISFIPKSWNDSSLFFLVKGFFKYYSEFDMASMVLCPFLGVAIRKNLFHPGMEHHLPAEFEKYKSNRSKGLAESLKVDQLLCIQDPFVHNHNVALQNRSNIVEHFKILCHIYASEHHNQEMLSAFPSPGN